MAGEFVRTPKKGVTAGRYHARANIPTIEIALCLFSLASVVASLETGHWFATPFAMLFTFGYGYVASLVVSEQFARRKASIQAIEEGERVSTDSVAPGALEEASASEELAA
jgi:hypothetical protein